MTDTPTTEAADEIMRRLSAHNPRSREHHEEYADGRSFWRCIPIRDAVEVRQAAIEAEARAELDVAPHPDENHEFRTICQRCGEPGYLHVSLITPDETVVTMTRDAALARQADHE